MRRLQISLQILWIKFQLWVYLRRLKSAIQFLRTLSPSEAAPILVKWKWDASRLPDQRLRESMLDGIYRLEKQIADNSLL